MKKLNLLAILITAMCGLSNAQTYQNNTATGLAVAESRSSGCGMGVQPGVQMSDINVPISGIIGDPSKVTIEMGLSASWAGDVQIDLISPTGEAITLIRRLAASSNTACGNSGDFIPGNLLSFNSANTNPINLTGINGTIPIPAGFYAPSYGIAKYPAYIPGNLTTFFTGLSISGNWRLMLYDFGDGEPSIINNWKISFAPGATLKTSNVNVFVGGIILKQNPVDDQLLINVSDNFKTLLFEIYDASGKMLKTESISNKGKDFEINIQELVPGMYLLLPVKDGERQQAIEFIKK